MAPSQHDGASTLKNSSPVPLPVIALGTWDADVDSRKQCEDSVVLALKEGYRHIDTAALYETEHAVGNAIKRSGVPREQITVVTKFWNHVHEPEDVKKSLDESLQKLQLDYVDVYLMHWPIAFKRTLDFQTLKDDKDKPVVDQGLSADHERTWRAMEDLVSSGKARAIGVSNFTIPQLEKLLSYARIKPACNQVECHPYLPQTKLLEYCNKHAITLTGYSPLGSGKKHKDKPLLRDDPTVAKAAKKLGVDVAQVLIAWAVQRGTIPLPKSATPTRIKSNFHVPVLPDDIFNEISNISVDDPKRHVRYVNMPQIWGVDLFDEP